MKALKRLGWDLDDHLTRDEPDDDAPELFAHVAAATAHQCQRIFIAPDPDDEATSSVDGHQQFICVESTDTVLSLARCR